MWRFLLFCSVLIAKAEMQVSDKEQCLGETGFMVIENTSLESANSETYENLSEEECTKICSNNNDNYKRDIACSSVNYNHATFTCTIHSTRLDSAGLVKRTSSFGNKYFEKICYQGNPSINCNSGLFIRVDNYVLSGFAVEVTLHDTIEDCISHCVANTTCKSAMYFYDEKECIINTETALSHPDNFKKEETDRVIYFENPCVEQSSVNIESTNTQKDTEYKSSGSTFESIEEGSGEELEQRSEEEEEEEEEEEMNENEIGEQLRQAVEDQSAESAVVSEKESTSVFTPSSHYKQEVKETTNDDEDKEQKDSEEATAKDHVIRKAGKTDHLNSAIRLKYNTHPRNYATHTFDLNEEELQVVEEKHRSKESLKQKKKKSSKIETIETIESENNINYFTEWSDWTTCTMMGERQIRKRQCTNLKKCFGPLMEFRNCSESNIPSKTEKPIQSVKSLVGIGPKLSIDQNQSAENSLPTTAGYWGPWSMLCQEFASSQPCNNGKMIGFESRECIAEDPAQCLGPFFRYCSIPC